MNSVASPEYIDPVLAVILAALAWGGYFISLRRETIRKRKESRKESN